MTNLRLALYQPDMPTNTGSMLRLGACLGVGVDVIEPCGFVWDDRKLQRVAMDYINHLDYRRHTNWDSFCTASDGKRLILLTTSGDTAYYDFMFKPDDVLLVGRESAGVPEAIHKGADARLIVPMQLGLRSLNVALAAAMVLGEALRQTR